MPRWIWLVLAAWGAVHPWSYFLPYLRENGWSLSGLIDAWYVNASSTGLTWDLTIVAVVLTVWVLVETFETRDWRRLIALPFAFGVGVSCGLPLYLWLRGRR